MIIYICKGDSCFDDEQPVCVGEPSEDAVETR